jgi:hypothetical protein
MLNSGTGAWCRLIGLRVAVSIHVDLEEGWRRTTADETLCVNCDCVLLLAGVGGASSRLIALAGA